MVVSGGGKQSCLADVNSNRAPPRIDGLILRGDRKRQQQISHKNSHIDVMVTTTSPLRSRASPIAPFTMFFHIPHGFPLPNCSRGTVAITSKPEVNDETPKMARLFRPRCRDSLRF